jgi:hypothetical protein
MYTVFELANSQQNLIRVVWSRVYPDHTEYSHELFSTIDEAYAFSSVIVKNPSIDNAYIYNESTGKIINIKVKTGINR